MGRASRQLAQVEASQKEEVDQEVGEIEVMDSRPDNIDAETWALIQETGKLATERLYEILASPRFVRLKATEKAKLIQLAQNRAFGMPQSNRQDTNRRRAGYTDATAASLRELADRTHLPEYRKARQPNEVIDAEFTED